MRTTLDIDDDVLLAVKARARRERRSAGAVLSELARARLNSGLTAVGADFHGFVTIPSRDVVVTDELVEELIEGGGE
jgi:hypothetical protein